VPCLSTARSPLIRTFLRWRRVSHQLFELARR
jgi:hypothetical protein